MQPTFPNLIAGAWLPAASGARFERRGAGGASIGTAARAGEEDVAAAFARLDALGGGWRRRSPRARREVLRRALARLAAARHAPQEGYDALRLGAERLAPHRERARREGERRLECPPDEHLSEGVALAHAPAVSLFAGWLECALPALAAGRPTVLVAGGVLPEPALELARCLLDAGVDEGALALLIDDGRTALRAAAGQPELVEVRAICSELERAELERRVARPARADGRRAPFGAGVIERAPPRLVLREPTSRGLAVREQEDVERAAERVLRAAFGAGEALSGQLDGRVGRVACHERRFAAFSAALLDGLERFAAEPEPVALLERALPGRLRELVRLGLDEGATLLTASSGLQESREGPQGAILAPSVFTNVEPRMRLAKTRWPLPLLLLSRARDDGEAERRAGGSERPAG